MNMSIEKLGILGFVIIILLIIMRIAIIYTDKLAAINESESANARAMAAYNEAQKGCPHGVSSIMWDNYAAGKISSVFCN